MVLSECDRVTLAGAIYSRMTYVQARYQAAWERYCTTPERAARVDAGETYCRLASAWERLVLAHQLITQGTIGKRYMPARKAGAS